MSKSAQAAKAAAFRKMHDRSAILLLPNAWDGMSARILESAGFGAIATTSAGVSWSLGYADGERAPRDEVIAATARIARCIQVPLSADIESGFAATLEELERSVRAFIDAGAIGINLEDTLTGSERLRDTEASAARIATARAAANASGIDIVINARTDTYLHPFAGDDSERFEQTVQRARAYLEAGADCIYPIGLSQVQEVDRFVSALNAPINLAARPGMPDLDELQRLGVARMSTATRLSAIAWSALDHTARELRASRNFASLAPKLTHSDLQELFSAQ